MAGGAASELSNGGMVTKLEAAKIAVAAGCRMVIADGRDASARARSRRRALHLVPARADPADGAQADGSPARCKPAGALMVDDGAAARCAPARACCRPASPPSRASFKRGDAVVDAGAPARELGARPGGL